MKLMALLGYPRKDGHTAHLTELFLQGAASAGADIQHVYLADLDVRPCIGCYCCWTQTPGQCIQHDDMAALLEQFLDADLVLIASPIYAYSVSAFIKSFMERTLAIMSPGTEIGPCGIEHNKWRYPGRGPKRMAGILAAALKSPAVLRPSIETLELYAEATRMTCAGILVRPESYALRFPQAAPFTTKMILNGFKQAGAEFVRQNRIPEALLSDASAPLVADLEHLARYSTVYWDHALELRDDCEAAGEAAGNDMRILIHEMARTTNPAALQGITARLLFEFPDKQLVYTLTIKDGTCSVAETPCESPDLSIRCPAEVWAGVKKQTISGVQLMTRPDVTIKGNMTLFRNLPRYFPPPTG